MKNNICSFKRMLPHKEEGNKEKCKKILEILNEYNCNLTKKRFKL